jgi:PAS domain S-box-containing protein
MGIFHTTPDGRYLSSNPAGFRMYGYESAEDMMESVTDMSWQIYVNPEDRAKYKDIVESKGRIEAFEVEHYRKDKSKIWVVLNSRAVRDSDDRTLYYETTIEDITERKQSEILYKTLADASHAGVYIVQDGKFQFVNPHIPEYSGYSESELIGKDSFSFVHPDDRGRLRGNTIAMLKGKRNNPYEYRIIDRNGKIRWLMETVRSITYGGKRAVLGNTMDITERYQMENLLRQSQKMQAIGTLAGGIAHDFNNILMAIMGYTEMALVSPEVNEHLRRYLEQVFKASKRARDLVKQILAFSRRSDEKPRPLKVSPIVRETLKLLRASLPSTIRIHQDIDVESDVVLADPTQIHQILMNLCTNAGHAMSGRKGELKVSLCPVEINSCDELSIHHGLSPGMFLQLTISDTGVGIAPEIMDRIYDPFFTTKKPGEGTGMGLSVVYGIVKSFGGAITVESEMEKGSRFNVYLPLLMDEEVEWEREDSSPIVGGREHILFVDDEANLVELGMELLTSLGYDVTGRTSSLEALELFRAKPDRFNLVITDMTMPNMTGVDLAREMMFIRPDLPIILCTGFSELISMEKATSIGIRRFITKPLLIKSLAMAIREVIDTR